jgi:hypothetical protein
MATSKSNRAPQRKLTQQEVHALQESLRRSCFCESDHDLPIAGTPPPEPCPFCGSHDIVLVLDPADEKGRPRAHVECTGCGAEGTPVNCHGDEFRSTYDVIHEACGKWNRRASNASRRREVRQ